MHKRFTEDKEFQKMTWNKYVKAPQIIIKCLQNLLTCFGISQRYFSKSLDTFWIVDRSVFVKNAW